MPQIFFFFEQRGMSDGGDGEVPVPAAQPALSSSLSDSVELRDVTLILLINTPVTITLLLVFYLLRVWRKQRLSHNPLIEHNIQGRPLVGYDLGKDNIWKVWSRIWNVDLDTVTVRCGGERKKNNIFFFVNILIFSSNKNKKKFLLVCL